MDYGAHVYLIIDIINAKTMCCLIFCDDVYNN